MRTTYRFGAMHPRGRHAAALLALCVLLLAGVAAAGSGPMVDFRVPSPAYMTPGEVSRLEVGLTNQAASTLDLRVSLEVSGATYPARVDVSPDAHRLTLRPGATRDVTFELHANDGPFPPKLEAKAFARWGEGGKSHEEVVVFTLKVREPSAPPAASDNWVRQGLYVAAGVGAAGVAVGLVGALRRREWGMVGMLPFYRLYTRIRRSDVLDQETRRRVFTAIEQEPGAHFSKLKRETGLPNGALYHHLRVLQEHGLVTSRRVGGYRVYTPAGVPLEERPRITPTEQEILGLVPSEGITQAEIAERLGVTRQGANYHVRNLREKGALDVRLVSGQWRCFRTGDPEGAGDE